MSNNPKYDAWTSFEKIKEQAQLVLSDTTLDRINIERQKIYWEKILDNVDIDVIERYLRKKKLEKIKTDNDR